MKDLADVVVVGDGPKKDLLPNTVKHHAKLGRKEIVEKFTQADMLVLTSYFEGFARVVMEAAAAGIPVVTTKVSGIQGIVENDVSGYVFDQGDEKAFIEAVELLVRDTEKRQKLGREIREKARAMLSIETMLQKQKEVYDYLK
jgi:glycosyltransferase involved in cell wall biosynthesis